MYTEQLTEQLAVVATIDPDAYTADAYTSDWIDMSQRRRALFVVMAGTLGTAATLDAKVQEATSAAGAGAQDLSGKAITQMVKATDDDKQAIIEVVAEEMSAGFRYLALVMTVGEATSDAGAIALANVSRYKPDTDDLASVAEIVT